MDYVFINAAALGLPIVAYDTAGLGQFIRHCRTGLVIPPGQSTAFVSAIVDLLRESQLRAALSLQAQQFASEHSWGRLAQTIIAS